MPDVYPPHIFGMHDRGGEHLMLQKQKRGWVLVTEAIGSDPHNYAGSNYTDLSNQGLGVLVRLNNGYSTAGTIPTSDRYDDFARRCGNFVQASPGCHVWIIGNEMNLAWERPGGPNGQVITPQLYATCFKKCRNQIRQRPGHQDDQVVIGAVAPWNIQTQYPGNPSGDWVKYFTDILNLLGQEIDGISVHAYTHGQDPNFVFSDAKMNAPFQNYHWHFRTYRDFMKAIPEGLNNRPVYLTETDQNDAWRDANTGWVRNAYREINDWNRNAANQPIQALILFRWIIGNPNDPQQVGWAIENKPGVQADFRDAMNNEYQLVMPLTKPAYRVAWLGVNAPTVWARGGTAQFGVRIRNDGRLTWPNTGVNAVRLAYRWISASGAVTEGSRRSLPRAVAPGETATWSNVAVRAPDKPGYYTLEMDLVQGASNWFAQQGSPVWRARNVRVGDLYRVAWLSVTTPLEGTVGDTVTVPVRIRNEGAFTWPPAGQNPVNLTYKWLEIDHNVIVADGLRTPIGQTVGPLEEIMLNASVQMPADPGPYILQFDMVHEFVVWFQWKGSPVHEEQIEVKAAAPDLAADWLEYVGPERLVLGQVGNAYVEVRNVGQAPWPSSGPDAIQLGYRWLDEQGQQVFVSGTTLAPLTSAIDPGEVAVFANLQFLVPQAPDTYRLIWDLVQSGAWLSAQGVAILERPIQVSAAEYAVEWVSLRPWPAWLPPGEEHHTSLRLHNVGTRQWQAGGDHPVHLAYHWFTQSGRLSEPWETFRLLLPRDILPGASVDLEDVAFTTPPVLDSYVLRWDLVEEGEAWFFRRGGVPLEVPIEIAEQSLFLPWTAQASHNPDDVALAFDGNPDTLWDSKANQEPGMWFQVDLGRILVLDRVKAHSPGRGFPAGYRILLSENGQDWQLVAAKEKNWTDVDVAFSPCKGRYLRLEQAGSLDWPATWMISEITVSVTRPWASAEASHYNDDAPKAVDANPDTAWTTRAVKQKPGIWFHLDMGSVRQIQRVTLEHPSNQFPRGYVVQVSADGVNWQEVGRADDNWGRVDARFQPVAARHVRVETTETSRFSAWGISEFVVWRTLPIWLRGRED